MTDRILSSEDLQKLRVAVSLLENPSFIVKLSDYLGRPIEFAIEALPDKASDIVLRATQEALKKTLDLALVTMNASPSEESWDRLHIAASALTGGVGGFFGLAGLPFELPITTTLMFRSIADVARSESADLSEEGDSVYISTFRSPVESSAKTGDGEHLPCCQPSTMVDHFRNSYLCPSVRS